MTELPGSVSGRVLERCLAHNLLQLILLPTEACNFRCTYCYEDFRLGRMDHAVVRGVKSLLTERAPELDRLTLSWFGGEPLLARDIVADVMEHAQGLVRENPRMRLAGDMTTNAFLLDRGALEGLLELGVSTYQVTLDGPQEVHDQKRVQAGGGPTFARIWRNLEAAREVQSDFRFTVRLHVDGENRGSLERLVATFEESFGADPRFVLYFRPLSRFGGPNDAALPVLDRAAREPALERLRAGASDRGLPVSRPDACEEPVCYAAMGNSFVIRSDGRVGKCTLALERPENTVGRIAESGRIELDRDRVLLWMRGLVEDDQSVLGCPLVGL